MLHYAVKYISYKNAELLNTLQFNSFFFLLPYTLSCVISETSSPMKKKHCSQGAKRKQGKGAWKTPTRNHSPWRGDSRIIYSRLGGHRPLTNKFSLAASFRSHTRVPFPGRFQDIGVLVPVTRRSLHPRAPC